jgi:hypothetical protein
MENGIVFRLKKFAKLLINLKIIKIIMGGWLEPPPWPIWGGRTTPIGFGVAEPPPRPLVFFFLVSIDFFFF